MRRRLLLGLGLVVVAAAAFAGVFWLVRRRVATGPEPPGSGPVQAAPAPAGGVARGVLGPRGAAALEQLELPALEVAPEQPVQRDERRPAGRAPAQACAPCHGEIVQRYARHAMAHTGLRPVDLAQLGPRFASTRPVRHPSRALEYQPLRDGDRLLVEERSLSRSGVILARRRLPVTHTLSSGAYATAFAFQQDGRIYQLPIDHFTEAAGFGLDPGFGDSAGAPVQLIGAFCLSCHSDDPGHLGDAEDLVLAPLPAGISCERCHGPGVRHVETGAPADIVNPGRLPPARQLDTCAQCHLNGAIVQRPGRTLFDYHAGQALPEFRTNWLDEPPDPAAFELIGHVERLLRSPCFQRSNGALTCTTCHDPHTSSREQRADFDGKCAGCHSAPARVCSASAEARARQADHCVGCHMRRGGAADVPSIVMTDHWIQKPGAPPRQGGPTRVGAYATLLGEPVTGPDLALSEAVGLIDAGHLENGVPRLVRLLPASPPAARGAAYGALARVFAQLGRPRETARAFAGMLALRPDAPEALLGYAGALVEVGGAAEAAAAQRALTRLRTLDAGAPEALELEGLLALQAGDRAVARARFAAAAHAPRAARARAGLAFLALAQGDCTAALPALEALRPDDPTNRRVLRAILGCRPDHADARAALAELEKTGEDSQRVTAFLPAELR